MRPWHLFTAILGLALTLRLALALFYPHYWGVDGGASLLTVNAVLGDEPTGAGFPKPPLAPGWTLAPFVLGFGPDVGYKVWSALFACLPLIPVYLLAKQYTDSAKAGLFALTFAAVDWRWGEMFVTGAHPLAAFALLGMAFWSINRLAQWWEWRSVIILTLSVGLIPWVNQTAAGLALIVLPVYYLSLLGFTWHKYRADWMYGPRLNNLIWFVLPPSLIGGAIALGALPWYMQTLPGSDILAFDGPVLYWAWGINTIQAFFIALPLGVFVIWKAASAELKALAAALLVLGFLVNWMSFDEVLINPPYRARYLMAMAFYPLIAWVIWKHWLPRIDTRLAWGLGAAAFIYFASAFVWVVKIQNEYSLMVTQETAEGLEWLKAHDPEAGVATNSFTLSLWVAGLNKVHSPFAFTAPPPPAYIEDDRHLRCLLNWVDDCRPARAQDALEIKYILIDERFPYYNERAPGNYKAPPDQWERTARAPWLELAYQKGTTKIWRVKNDSESISAEKGQSLKR